MAHPDYPDFNDQPHLVARVAATQTTVNAMKGKPFKWGKADCATLAAFHLKQMGHAPGAGRFGYYQSPVSAWKALQKLGFATMADVLDDLKLPRIAPAAALPGDILGFGHPDQPLTVALSIVIGNGRALGFMDNGDGHRCHIYPPIMAAEGVEYMSWRAAPLPREGP